MIIAIYILFILWLFWLWYPSNSPQIVRSNPIREFYKFRSIGDVIQTYSPSTRFVGADGKTVYELQQRQDHDGAKWAFYVVIGHSSGTSAANGTYDNPTDALNSFYALSHHNELKLMIGNAK